MDHSLEKLSASDGSWAGFEANWRAQCEAFGEDFDQYALGSLPVLKDLAENDKKDAAVFALRGEDSGFAAACQVNSAFLPGYDGKVLRIRHILLSPTLDYGELPLSEYAKIMSRVFSRTVALSARDMPSDHVKFHLRSPADIQFFSSALSMLKDLELFSSVALRGAWLYLSLNRPSIDGAKGVEG